MDSQAGTKHEAVQVPLDGARFQKVLDLLALGLYQHHFGERWVGSIRVHPDFIAFEGAESPADIDANRLILLECAKNCSSMNRSTARILVCSGIRYTSRRAHSNV